MTIDPGIGVDFGDYAGFLPGLVISIVVALILSARVARRLHATRIVAWLLLASLGAVLSATVTPSREALLLHPFTWTLTCDLSRIGPAGSVDYLAIDTTLLNVVLFVPLGVAIGLLPRSQLKAAVVVGAMVLPIGIETIQLVLVPLGRACQSGDVFDNLVGLVLGLGLGMAGAWFSRRVVGRSNE